jgi:5-methylcytosine-specific restriction protein A
MPVEDFEVGRTYNRRADIHAKYGGQMQSGISTPASHPLIFAFTGATGRQHGYADEWTQDGALRYFGEGQAGDMTLGRQQGDCAPRSRWQGVVTFRGAGGR